jgi:hypothetical protein
VPEQAAHGSPGESGYISDESPSLCLVVAGLVFVYPVREEENMNEQQLTEQLHIRVTSGLRSRIKSQAQRLHVPERDIVRMILATALSSDDIATRILDPVIQAARKREGRS